MNILFRQDAFEQYRNWEREDARIFRRLNALITEVMRDPFHGTGKPEPLKHELAGYWSRRINKEHRLVYEVTEGQITVISCKYHY